MSLPQFPADFRRPQLFRGQSGIGFVQLVCELVRSVVPGMPVYEGVEAGNVSITDYFHLSFNYLSLIHVNH